MTHSICTSDADGTLSHFQRLGRALFAPDIEPRPRIEHLFEHEAPEFGLNYGFLSSIDRENETERFEIVHGSHEKIKPGATIHLSKSYCRKTIEAPQGTVAINDSLAEGLEDDPAYEEFEFRSYLGTTVSVADELYGTICFVDSAARAEPITDKEKALVEMYGMWVGYILVLWDKPSIPETRFDTIEERDVSSEAIDSMMEALKSRTRRGILMTLLGDTTEVSIHVLERRLESEKGRLTLYHNHLPKLANLEYIEWDDDESTIDKGPKFSEVKPLVQQLNEYETAFPR